MQDLTRGMKHLYPATTWIFALLGAVIMDYFTGYRLIVHKGSIALIAFCLLVLVGSYLIGRLLREDEAEVSTLTDCAYCDEIIIFDGHHWSHVSGVENHPAVPWWTGVLAGEDEA